MKGIDKLRATLEPLGITVPGKPNTVYDGRDGLSKLEDEVARLRGALEQVEWVGIYHASSLPQDMRCPRCFRHRADGHKDDCSLAAALTPPAGEER